MIMILVLALITIGFAQLGRREQKNSLDKQLATQAYYAAETGINDAYNLAMVKGGLYDQVKGGANISSTDCLNNSSLWWNHDPVTGLPSTPIKSEIDRTMGTSYSCVMVDLHPRSLTYSGVSPGAYRDVVFSAVDADTGTDTNLRKLFVYWGSADNHKSLETTGGFKPTAGTNPNWGADSLGLIQFSITPMSSSFTRDNLMNNTFTVYMYPQNGSGTVSFAANPDGDGAVVNGKCDGAGDNQCMVAIDNIPVADNYLIHFIDYYDSSNVKINGQDSSGKLIGFEGGQMVVDSTGRARDVLKRLQVHIPLTIDGTKPTEAIEGQSVCKRFTTNPGDAPTPHKPGTYSGNACNFWAQ
jgi:hypothetical protein